MPKSYNDEAHAHAANLYVMAGYTYGELTEVDGLPNSKGTFSSWNAKGLGMNGRPWDTVKKDLSAQQQAMEEKESIDNAIGKVDEVADRIGPLLAQAADELRTQLMRDGDANPTWKKYANLLDMVGDYARQKHVSGIHDRLEKLADETGKILGQQISDDAILRRLNTQIQRAFNEAYRDIDDMLGIDE
jgi:hypothetical protein